MRQKRIHLGVGMALIMMVINAGKIFACSTCYGDVGSPQTQGMNMAILTMLGITAGVLGSLVAFIIHFRKRLLHASESEMHPLVSRGERFGS